MCAHWLGRSRRELQATKPLPGPESFSMRVQNGVLVPLGYGNTSAPTGSRRLCPLRRNGAPDDERLFFLKISRSRLWRRARRIP